MNTFFNKINKRYSILVSGLICILFCQLAGAQTLSPPSAICTETSLQQLVDTDYSSQTGGNWYVDGYKINDPSQYIFSRFDDGRMLRYITPTDTSNAVALSVKGHPVLKSITTTPSPLTGLTTGDNISITAADILTNGSVISAYGLTVNRIEKNSNTTSPNGLSYNVEMQDNAKKVGLSITHDCDNTLFEHTVKDTILLTPSNEGFPSDLTPIKKDVFPVVLGEDFTDPVIEYDPNDGDYYYVDPTTTDPDGTVKNIFIPYVGKTFSCKVYNKLIDAIGPLGTEGRTIFVAASANIYYPKYDGTTWGTAGIEHPLSREGLRLVGADGANPPRIGYNRRSDAADTHIKYRLYDDGIIFDNLIFDGESKSFAGNGSGSSNEKNSYYYMIINGTVTMKNIKFRNIGNGGNSYSVLSFPDTQHKPRYFLNVTIESAKTSSSYALVNISAAQNIYFKNFKVETTSGKSTVDISTSTSLTAFNPANIIFAGTLDIPDGKIISIQRYQSRTISLPKEYRYMQLRNNWLPNSTSMNGSAIHIQKGGFANNAVYLVNYDALENVYVLRDGQSRSLTNQFTDLKDLLTHTDTNLACTLPEANVKLVGTSLGGFTLPDFGSHPFPVNIVGVKNTSEVISQLAQNVLIPYSGSSISFPTSGAENIKLHNIDFSGSNGYTIYDAVTSSQGGRDDIANSRQGNFYNCLFKDYTADQEMILGIKIPITYNPNGGSPNTDKIFNDSNTGTYTILDYNDTALGFNPPTANHTFVGWNTAANGAGVAYTVGTEYVLTGALTLYAQWKDNSLPPVTPTNKVIYHPNGGGGTTHAINCNADGSHKILSYTDAPLLYTTPTTNHVFVNWNTEPDGSGISYYPGYTISFAADVNLYAQWKVGTTPPGPGPTPGINIKEGGAFCQNEAFVSIFYDILYNAHPMEYTVIFSEEAQKAGFENITTYSKLPDKHITFPIPFAVPKGKYKGTIVLRSSADANIISDYPFEFEIQNTVVIIQQPESATSCKGDGYTFTVEATGESLSYQWYYKGEKITGATKEQYSNNLSEETVGDYYVIVTGICGAVKSDTVYATMKTLGILMKWDDVLYVDNTSGRYVRFQWYKDGQAIMQHGTSVYYTDIDGLSGTYFVRAYYADGTYDESCAMYFSSNSPKASLNVYPNPVQRNTNVSVVLSEESEPDAIIELFNMSGVRVYQTKTSITKTDIPVSLPVGTYIIKTTLRSGKAISKKLIVK